MLKFFLKLYILFFTLTVSAADFKSVELSNLNGQKFSLASLAQNDLIVMIAFGSECPILRKHIPQINALHEKFRALKINMVLINAIQNQPKEQLLEEIKSYSITPEIYQDAAPSLLKQLNFTTFSEAVLLRLSSNDVLYQGSINNQFTFDLSRPAPTKNFLADAVKSAINGKVIKIKKDAPFGCSITY